MHLEKASLLQRQTVTTFEVKVDVVGDFLEVRMRMSRHKGCDDNHDNDADDIDGGDWDCEYDNYNNDADNNGGDNNYGND